jgi:EAL domain-containing protein (putative c-di-GMP-specific phosphodiesterase class I)
MLAHLRRVVAEPLIIDGLPIALEASVGYALSPDDGSDADGLVRRAEAAMHIAKQHRSGALRYAATRTTYDASALTLLAELGPAIERGQLVLHYQAKGDLTRRAVTGVEALLRWNHPRHGLIYPDSFVPRAEQTELIDAVTRWVLAEACRAVAEIDALAERTIAVNVSARSLCRVGFAEEVIATLAEHGTDPRRIVIEITETSLMSDPTAAGDTVRALHEAGLRISIDDFGAGQTSLEYLAMLPVDELKIDKSFVLGMVADQRKATIVRSVVGLGHALGLSVTAEGVETREHLNRLGGFGCDKAQGYLLARPCAAEDLAAALDAAEAVLERRTNLGRPGGRGAGVARAHRPRTEPATVVGAPGDGA